MNKKQKKNLIRILISAILMIILHFLPVYGLLRFFLYLVPYVIVGYDVVLRAIKGIRNFQPLDENLLMTLATVGAMVLAVVQDGDYTEAIAVMLFYQIGEWFQSYAVGKSRKSISALMDIRPEYANIEDGKGGYTKVDPDEVEVGSVIVVRAGEKIPIDGVVIEGASSLDTAALTGESIPRDVSKGSEVISGCINQSGLLKICTTKEFDESTASKILEMIEDASSRKSKSEDFIGKFARVYTPAVVISAVLLAILPPMVLLVMGRDSHVFDWIYRALTFLVISCPCALVVSIPLSFFAGIGGASSVGVLIKGSNYLEALSKVSTLVFDKTGTLTKGQFDVSAVHTTDIQREELLHLAAHAEENSTHPIAVSLRKAYQYTKDDHCDVEDVTELAGRGVQAKINGHVICVGNEKLMEEVGAKWQPCHKTGTIIHISRDGEYMGHIVVSDVIKPHSKKALQNLKSMGMKKLVMLTGDQEDVAKEVASQLPLDEYYAKLLPGDKVNQVEKLLNDPNRHGLLAFVGDGINDAPVLSRVDVGIAMGALGSDAAIEAADVVLMDDDPAKIAVAIRIAKKCMRIVYENLYFAIGIKLICLLLGAIGIANMWLAVFADVGVMVLAVLNAIRCLLVKKS